MRMNQVDFGQGNSTNQDIAPLNCVTPRGSTTAISSQIEGAYDYMMLENSRERFCSTVEEIARRGMWALCLASVIGRENYVYPRPHIFDLRGGRGKPLLRWHVRTIRLQRDWFVQLRPD